MLLAMIVAMLRIVLLLDPPTGGSGSGSGSGDGSTDPGSGGGGGGGSGDGTRSRAPAWDDDDAPPGVDHPNAYAAALDRWRERARESRQTIRDMEREHAEAVAAAERRGREAVRAELEPRLREHRIRNAILEHHGGRFVDMGDAVRELADGAGEWLGDDGAVDAGKLTAAMDDVLERKPHYKADGYTPAGDGDGDGDGDEAGRDRGQRLDRATGAGPGCRRLADPDHHPVRRAEGGPGGHGRPRGPDHRHQGTQAGRRMTARRWRVAIVTCANRVLAAVMGAPMTTREERERAARETYGEEAPDGRR